MRAQTSLCLHNEINPSDIMLGPSYAGTCASEVNVCERGFVCQSVKMGSRWLRGGDLRMNSGFVMRVCGMGERDV